MTIYCNHCGTAESPDFILVDERGDIVGCDDCAKVGNVNIPCKDDEDYVIPVDVYYVGDNVYVAEEDADLVPDAMPVSVYGQDDSGYIDRADFSDEMAERRYMEYEYRCSRF